MLLFLYTHGDISATGTWLLEKKGVGVGNGRMRFFFGLVGFL
jgi:hypothetical protein